MTDEQDRRKSEGLDANLSVLGDEGKEPHVARVGDAPRPTEDTSLERELDKGNAGAGDGNLDETSQRAAKDSIRDTTQGLADNR